MATTRDIFEPFLIEAAERRRAAERANEIAELVRQDPIAYAVHRVAKQENWTPQRFLEELVIALGKANAELREAAARNALGRLGT